MNDMACAPPPADAFAAQGRWRRTFRLHAPWRLEPLAVHHAGELAVQYRSAATAALTGLPPIADGFDAEQWIAARNEESEATYALMHDRFGLVGYGDLYLCRDEGYLCLWIGEDFRGRGWSKVLIGHLCALAQRAGLSVIWSSAYRSNRASLRAMASVGFCTLDLHALAPDDGRAFVCMPFVHRSPARLRKGMVDFCIRTDTGVRFAGHPSSFVTASGEPS
jgi:GNAT superfamily N-acetyltransferase